MARLNARDEARLKQYEVLLAQEPKALVFAALASLYARKYEFEKAVDVLTRGLAVFPNYFSARVLLAKCYIALDRFDDARAELDQVLANDPYNLSALGVAGDELRNRGRFADARELYLKILEFEPENEEYAYKLELLETLMDGGPFGERPAAAVAEPPAVQTPPPVAAPEPVIAAAAEPVIPEPVLEAEPAVAAAAEEFDLQTMAADKTETAAPVAEEAVTPDEKLATLTLARIYEDQGLFLRAKEVIARVLEREPDNDEARRVDAHLTALLGGEQSPTGESIVRLIKGVEAASGVLEADELEVWEETAAGVAEALTGFEDLTLARAVAAAAGLRGADEFVCLSTDEPASWELDLPPVPLTLGAEGAEEWDIILPFKAGGHFASGVTVLAYAVAASPGARGAEEFDLPPRAAVRAVVEVDDFLIDLKAAVAAHKKEARAAVAPVRRPAPPRSPAAATLPPAPPEPEPEPPRDELAVKPERYLEKKKPTTAKKEPGRDEDFLSWLDSIKLKEI